MLEKHIDTIDRMIKIVIGIILFYIGYKYETWWGALGLIPFIRGIYKPLSCWGDRIPSIDQNNDKCE